MFPNIVISLNNVCCFTNRTFECIWLIEFRLSSNHCCTICRKPKSQSTRENVHTISTRRRPHQSRIESSLLWPKVRHARQRSYQSFRPNARQIIFRYVATLCCVCPFGSGAATSTAAENAISTKRWRCYDSTIATVLPQTRRHNFPAKLFRSVACIGNYRAKELHRTHAVAVWHWHQRQ